MDWTMFMKTELHLMCPLLCTASGGRATDPYKLTALFILISPVTLMRGKAQLMSHKIIIQTKRTFKLC